MTRTRSQAGAEERFVAKLGPLVGDRCRLWLGARNRDGYGSFRGDGGATVLAHRFAWTIAHGPVPRGMHVLHRCDTPACCRHDHLFLGSHADNMADRLAKGRYRGLAGVRNARAKLTDASVAEIRAMLAGGSSQSECARAFGVSQQTVSNIGRLASWRHA